MLMPRHPSLLSSGEDRIAFFGARILDACRVEGFRQPLVAADLGHADRLPSFSEISVKPASRFANRYRAPVRRHPRRCGCRACRISSTIGSRSTSSR